MADATVHDGGISGTTMERPALRQRLADIASGKIDTVLVCKVDRLMRTLSDFAKIVDIFDAHAVAFVLDTQQFNTKTLMGRLMLNMLLSFAQFEREESMTGPYVSRLVRTASLAPDITQAILSGRTQPPVETVVKLMPSGTVGADWQEQRAMFGFTRKR